MALGTLTSVSATAAVGPVFIDVVTLVGDSSYPTGGSTGLAAKLKTLRGDQRAIVDVTVSDGGGYVAGYDPAGDTFKCYEQDAGGALAQVANTTNLSGVTFKLTIISK